MSFWSNVSGAVSRAGKSMAPRKPRNVPNYKNPATAHKQYGKDYSESSVTSSNRWRTGSYMGSKTKVRPGAFSGGGGYGGAYGGGGGGDWRSSPLFKQLFGEYQSAYDAAKKANEARYQEMLGLSENLGQADRAAIERQMRGAASKVGQQAVTSGLSNVPGAVASAQAIAQQPYLTAQGRLQDALRRERLGIIERRTDAYPSMDQFINLAQKAGRYSDSYSSAQPRGGGGGGYSRGGFMVRGASAGGIFRL